MDSNKILKLMREYKWLSRNIAEKYYIMLHKGFMDKEDYIQAADIGLFQAAEKYDETKGLFKNYAVEFIKSEIFHTYRQENGHFPISQKDYQNINAVFKAMEKGFYKPVEIACKTGLSEKVVKQSLEIMNTTGYLEYKSESIEDMFDVAGSDDVESDYIETSLKIDLSACLDSLTEKERYVIKARYGIDGEPHTLQEIGDVIEAAPKVVKDIEVKGIRKMRHPDNSRKLVVYRK